MNSRQLFGTLETNVRDLIALGIAQESVNPDSAASIYRACVVLSVSALDTYMHEKATEIYCLRFGNTSAENSIKQYLSISGSMDQSLVRYRLSFKTIVNPAGIDDAISSSGSDEKLVWRSIGISLGSRESRLRNILDLQVDRRNQIAHEADWDPARLIFRTISANSAQECIDCIVTVVDGIELNWT